LEHPAQPGQVGLALAHEAMSRDVWVEVARVRKEREARARYLSAQTPVAHFGLDLAERVLLAQAIPVELPDWVPTFIIKCVGSADDVLEGLPDVAPAPVKRLRRQVTKKMRQGSYVFTEAQMLQADLAYDRREAEKFPPQRVDYGN